MRLALLSFADVNNYGDKYFGPLCETELARRMPTVDFERISPSGVTVDGLIYHPYDRAYLSGFDGLLLVGGEIIHSEDQFLREIYQNHNIKISLTAPTDFVYDWTDLSVNYKAWLCLGATSVLPTMQSAAPRLRKAIPRLNLLTVRGLLSKNYLEDVLETNFLPISITPDLGWLIPEFHTSQAVRPNWQQLASRVGLYTGRPALVFQCMPPVLEMVATTRGKTTEELIDQIAKALLRIRQQTGLDIWLLSITHYAHDWSLLQTLHEAGEGQFGLWPSDLTMHETTEILLHSRVCVSSSLHASITCLAAGIPAAAILPVKGKFTELFGQQLRTEYLQPDWNNLEDLVGSLLAEPNQPLTDYARLMKGHLHRLFDRIAVELGQA